MKGKGAKISKAYFEEWGLPFLRDKYPDVAERVAAGLFKNSDSILADDEFTEANDHDWGLYFRLILPLDDFEAIGGSIDESMNTHAPKSFRGYTFERRKHVYVYSIRSFLLDHLGFSEIPKTTSDWFKGKWRLDKLEHRLYMLKHGQLFYDPLGEFTETRKKLSEYPKDILWKRLYGECWGVWHYGEGKFCDRVVKRGDILTADIAIASFVEHVMRLCFLCHHDFSPYWMWLPHEFKKLDESTDLEPMLTELIKMNDLQKQRDHVLHICDYMRMLLFKKGFLKNETNNFWTAFRQIKTNMSEPSLLEID